MPEGTVLPPTPQQRARLGLHVSTNPDVKKPAMLRPHATLGGGGGGGDWGPLLPWQAAAWHQSLLLPLPCVAVPRSLRMT